MRLRVSSVFAGPDAPRSPASAKSRIADSDPVPVLGVTPHRRNVGRPLQAPTEDKADSLREVHAGLLLRIVSATLKLRCRVACAMRVRFSVSVISLTMLPVGRLSKSVRARSKAATSVYRDVALWELLPRITVSGKPSVWQARNDGRVLQRSRHLIGSCFVLAISKLGQLGLVLPSGSLQAVRAPVYETLPPPQVSLVVFAETIMTSIAFIIVSIRWECRPCELVFVSGVVFRAGIPMLKPDPSGAEAGR